MIEQISPTELKSKLEKGEEIILIDVREPFEHDEYNIGGELIPLGTLMDSIETLEAHKPKTVVTYCRSGARSNAAAEALSNVGFTVLNLQGGMIRWRETYPE